MKKDISLRDDTSLKTIRRDLNDAIAAKYGAHLDPGETLLIDIETSSEVVSAKVTLENADQSSLFELEAAYLLSDQENLTKLQSSVALEQVVDYIDVILEEYFESQRYIRFNDDWRLDDYFGHMIRYRSAWRRPNLDALADAWLEANGDPDLVIDLQQKDEWDGE